MKEILLIIFTMNVFTLFGQNSLKVDPYWNFDQSNHFKPKLDTEDFFKLSGFDFCWFVLNTIPYDDVEKTKGDILSYGQKALYYWSFVEIQVPNGGFTQFYYNGYGKYVPVIIKGLKYIKDNKMADLVSRSYDLYLKESKTINDARKDGIEAFSNLYKELKHLDELDTEYYNLSEATKTKIENYVRKNPSEFCDNEITKKIESKFTGDFKTYYTEQNVKEIVPLSKGLVNGNYRSYYPNGNTKLEVTYLNGEQTGDIIEYYENGHKKTSELKSDTNNDIIHCKYYENGNLKSTIIQTSDNRRIIQNCFREDGTQILKDGTGLFIFEYTYGNGTIQRKEDEYLNGLRHGKQHTYNNNILTLYQEMANGREHGTTKTYDRNGKLKQEIVYKDGVEISRKEY